MVRLVVSDNVRNTLYNRWQIDFHIGNGWHPLFVSITIRGSFTSCSGVGTVAFELGFTSFSLPRARPAIWPCWPVWAFSRRHLLWPMNIPFFHLMLCYVALID